MIFAAISDPRTRSRLTTAVVAVATALVVLAIWVVVFTSTHTAYERALDHARSETHNLAAAFADEVARNLDSVAASMDAVAKRIQGGDDPRELHLWAKEIPILSGATIQAAIIGPDGWLVSTTLDPNPKPLDLSDRQHVRAHLDGKVLGLFIPKPVVGRVSKQVTINVTRRVEDKHGNLIGIVMFALAPGHLTGLARMVDLGSAGTIALLGFDNVVRARFTRAALDGLAGVGETMPGHRITASLINGATDGFLQGKSPLDGVVRIVSFRRVADHPLAVIAGLGEDEVMAPCRADQRSLIGIAAVATIVMIGFAAYLVLETRNRARHAAELASERSKLADANRELREAQDTLQDAVESIAEAFVIFDRDDRFVMFNDAYRQLYPQSTLVLRPGARFEDVLRHGTYAGEYSEALGREEDWIAARLTAHRTLSAPVEQRLADGRCVLIIERRMRNGGTAGLRVDITELKNAEARLRETMGHLERAQRIAHMGSIVCYLGTDYAEPSEEMYRIFGVDRATFIFSMENILTFVLPEDRDKLRQAQSLIADGVTPEPFEYRILRPDGAIREIYRETEIFFDGSGEPLGYASTLQDVTEVRAAQRRQRELEKQLQHAQKLEALGALAGGISHELNNALTPIGLLSEMMLKALPADSPEREDLEIIASAAERAQGLVRRILAFSRKPDTPREYIDLADVVRQSLRMLRPTIPVTIALKVEIAAVVSLFADRDEFQQVIVNIVNNAAQAIGNAMGSVSISLAEVKPPAGAEGSNGWVRLSVADTGRGMDAGTLDRIFEPFFTTKDVNSGTGLGLSVVHGIITDHGGRIEVDSAPGKGTRFDIYLPIEPAAALLAA